MQGICAHDPTAGGGLLDDGGDLPPTDAGVFDPSANPGALLGPLLLLIFCLLLFSLDRFSLHCSYRQNMPSNCGLGLYHDS